MCKLHRVCYHISHTAESRKWHIFSSDRGETCWWYSPFTNSHDNAKCFSSKLKVIVCLIWWSRFEATVCLVINVCTPCSPSERATLRGLLFESESHCLFDDRVWSHMCRSETFIFYFDRDATREGAFLWDLELPFAWGSMFVLRAHRAIASVNAYRICAPDSNAKHLEKSN